MNLKQKVRQALTEAKETKKPKRQYDFGCVMVALNLNKKDWNRIQDMIDEDDIYNGEGDDGGFGRELDPHVTVLFGIHDDVPDEDVEKLIGDIKTPKIELEKVSTFDNAQFDVLKFDVESEDLNELNKKFKTLPHTSSFPDYHPHATICYLKRGLGDKYKKIMNNVEPIQVKPSKILYSKPDGSKKDYKL